MTKIILLRHGETLANIAQIYQGQGDSELSPAGINQAESVAKFLSSTKIDCFFCSDLKRSLHTAQIISKAHSKKPAALQELRERYFGKWEGLSFNQINAEYSKLYKQWMKDPAKAIIPGAETLVALQKRAIRKIKQIIKKDKTILIVGHGGINRAILFYYLGLDLNCFWKIKQDNCCINMIEFKGKEMKARICVLNSTCFMGEKRLGSKRENPLI